MIAGATSLLGIRRESRWLRLLAGWHSGLLLALSVSCRAAELQLVPDAEPRRVFWGAARKVELTFRNATPNDLVANLRLRVYQASSATVMPLGEAQPWQPLRVLAKQTVVESAAFDFPEVRSETRFLVTVFALDDLAIGSREVLVYPTNLLAELRTLAGNKTIGIFDPLNELSPLLTRLGVAFHDLQEQGWEQFRGPLALIGPFGRRVQTPLPDLANRVAKFASQGIAVLWVQALPNREPQLEPRVYPLHWGAGRAIAASPQAFVNLPADPWSQLNLVHLARYALKPNEMALPEKNH